VLLVLAIVGIMAGLAIKGLRGLAKSDLRASSGKLSGAVRYLFDRASTTGKYHRLVIDVTEGRYWAEVSDDRFYVPRDAETERDVKRRLEKEVKLDEEERRRAEETKLGGGFDMSKVQPQDYRPKRVRFAAFRSAALKPVTMKNTKVVDVYSPHLADLATAGRAYVYFFPLGQTEASIIHLSDPRGETFYSLVIHPITGRVRIYNEYVKPPFQARYDDAGNAVMP
jgi:general secretion pathway protein H